jgi:hypothetical protein
VLLKALGRCLRRFADIKESSAWVGKLAAVELDDVDAAMWAASVHDESLAEESVDEPPFSGLCSLEGGVALLDGQVES